MGQETRNNHNANFMFNFGGASHQKNKIYYWIDKEYGYGGVVFQEGEYTNVTERSTFIVKSGTAIFQGKSITIATKTADNTENMLLLGSYHPNISPVGIYAFNRYDAKVYSFKILEDNLLIKNYIPVKRITDNVFGLYDTVNKEFHRSDSDFDFIYEEE